MNTPNRRFYKQEQEMLKHIRDNPGVTTMDLSILFSGPDATRQQLIGVLSSMMDRNEFVHVTTVQDHKATYACFSTVPPGIDPKRFERRSSNRAHLRKDMQDANDVALRAASMRQPEFKLAPPPPPPPNHHPPIKPGTFTIDLELLNGVKSAFTLDEARRMYDQLYRLFGSNGL